MNTNFVEMVKGCMELGMTLEEAKSYVLDCIKAMPKTEESNIPQTTEKTQKNKKATGAKAPTSEPKTEGTVVNSRKGISIKMEIVKGSGKGADKEFVKLIFSDKPSQKVRDDMKLHRFKYFKADNTWSAYKTDKAVEFAQSLIK